MKKLVCVILVLTFSTVASAIEAPPQAGKTNPLKEEMWLLNTAYKILVDALVLKNPSAIAGPFEKVLKAKPRTEAALEKGEIRLPKNNDKLGEFKKMDEEYHAMIENLIGLSKKGDMLGVHKLTHRLLDGCVRCHDRFRK